MPIPSPTNLRLAFVAMALAAPTSALAAGLGTATTGAFEVSIDIPPFGAAIAAAWSGAVGLDSLDTPGGGFMIQAPDSVSASGQGKMNIFSRTSAPVTARMANSGPTAASSSFATISAGPTTPLNGMVQSSFTIVPSGTAGAHGAHVVSVVVSSL